MIVWLAGEKGSGKNTFSDLLVDLVGGDFKVSQAAFSDPMYEMASILLSMSIEEVHIEKRTNKIVLDALLHIGTELGRNIVGKDVWNNILEKKINKFHADGGQLIIVDGVRLPFEVKFLRGFRKSFFLYVDRPGHSEGTTKQNKHSSNTDIETLKKRADMSILNDGDLEQLKDCARVVYDTFIKHRLEEARNDQRTIPSCK